MTPFLVKMDLCAPVILGRRLTLDALLASQIYERTGCVETAHETIPLERIGEIWTGSQAFVDGYVPSRMVTVIGSLRADHDLTPDIIAPSGRRKTFPTVESNRGDYKNFMSIYRTHEAPCVWFSGRGDVDAVTELLNGVSGIGTKRSHGYGQVVRVHVRAVSGENQYAGLKLADGSPARPIPAAFWQDISDKSALISAERFKPPYWDGKSVLCAVPNPPPEEINPQFFFSR